MKLEDVKINEIYIIPAEHAIRCGSAQSKKLSDGTVKIKIRSIDQDGSLRYYILDSNNNSVDSCSTCYKVEHLMQLNNLSTKLKNTMSTLTEKFALALTSEPQKTFRKVGITNSDNLLTEEGTKVFLAWLLNSKFGDEFKKDVADDMLKELEKNS